MQDVIQTTQEFSQYAAQQLKHLPSKFLDDIRETLSYEEKAVILTGGRDRRSNTSTTSADRTDSNLGDLLALIGNYRIPLGFFTFLGLVNFPHKINTRFLFTSENNKNRLFVINAKADVPNEPDAQIIFHDTQYISYPQITVDDNFLAYFNGIMVYCKGPTDELEKLTGDDGGVAVTVKLKKAAEKNETEGYCPFTGCIQVYQHK